MPVDGGLPVRRSYEAESSHVTTWTPGGELVYTTTHYATLPNPQLVALDIETGVRARIPLAQATEGSYAASGRSLYFVRPAFHRNVTKRYKGGTARKIWKFNRCDLPRPGHTARRRDCLFARADPKRPASGAERATLS